MLTCNGVHLNLALDVYCSAKTTDVNLIYTNSLFTTGSEMIVRAEHDGLLLFRVQQGSYYFLCLISGKMSLSPKNEAVSIWKLKWKMCVWLHYVTVGSQ